MTHRTGKFLDLLAHSVLGLTDIYNLLPQYVVNVANVSDFQKRLQICVVEMDVCGQPGWDSVFSPRNTIWNNKLRGSYEWSPPGMKNSAYNKDMDLSKSETNREAIRMFAF